ncbi:hypothetical protein HZZ02_00245 [Streptococcus danieliae]|nr:hypothetical protein [Streptococcus danieliae]
MAKSESNASVRFEGVKSFIAPSHDFGSGLDGVAGTIDKLPLTSQATLFKGVGSGTPAGSGDGYGLILEKNQPIRVSYTNLTNTSYKGQKITRLDYTYELLSTFAEDGKATAFIYTDPTKTIYIGTHGNNQGQVDFAIRQTMTYFFEDGSPVIFDKDKTALLSFASRNNSFEFGEQEFVQLDANLSFIPITGSSVSGENGYVAARGSNNSKVDGSKFDRSEWDQDGHSNEYYGAGVALATGGEISFTFGIRYNPNDIQKSANPSRLRDRSRQWFTVNADIKASGLIQMEKPGNPPVAPVKPKLLTKKLEAPKKPLQPKEPAYATVSQPVQPKKPELKVIPDLPPLTVTAIKPIAPKAPVVFLHQIRYKKPLPSISVTQPTRPTKRPLSPKPVRPVTNTRPVVSYPAHTRVYPAPTFNYNQYQGIRYRQSYVPSASVTDPNYASGWANQAAPTSRVTSPATNPEQKAPKPGENKPKSKGENKGQEKNWFSSNTGFNDKETKAVLDYIQQTGVKAKEKHPNDWAAYNRDIAQSLAYRSYKKDKLQKLFNIYLAQPLVKDSFALQALSDTHRNDVEDRNYPLDLPHMLTGLASLEKQNGRFDYTILIKRLAVQPVINPLANPVTFLWSAFNNGDTVKRNILLQQNSLVGDLLTYTSEKDYLSDMDAIILARHPKYKDLPLDERLIKYYSQDLEIKRTQLLYEVYGSDKTTAKLNLASEMLLSTLTLGGLGLGLYGIFRRGGIKHIGENFALLDQTVFENSFDRALQNPIKAIGKISTRIVSNTGKFLQKNIIKPVQSTIKSIKNRVSMRFATIQKNWQRKVGRSFVSMVKKEVRVSRQKTAQLAKTMKQGFKNIQSRVIKPMGNAIRKISKPLQNAVGRVVKPIQNAAPRLAQSTAIIAKSVVRTVARPVTQVVKPVIRAVVRPVVQAVKPVIRAVARPVVQAVKPVIRAVARPVVQAVKPVIRAVARPVAQVAKPIARAVAKVTQIFKPKPSAKRRK